MLEEYLRVRWREGEAAGSPQCCWGLKPREDLELNPYLTRITNIQCCEVVNLLESGVLRVCSVLEAQSAGRKVSWRRLLVWGLLAWRLLSVCVRSEAVQAGGKAWDCVEGPH